VLSSQSHIDQWLQLSHQWYSRALPFWCLPVTVQSRRRWSEAMVFGSILGILGRKSHSL
jgi:hypothetical protein